MPPSVPISLENSVDPGGSNSDAFGDGGGGGGRRRRGSRDRVEADGWAWAFARSGVTSGGGGFTSGGGVGDGGGGGSAHAEAEPRAEDWAWAFADSIDGVEVSGDGEENAPKSKTKKRFLPASQTHEWKTVEGGFQRLGFACTLGLAALVVTSILWMVSVPWVAWCLLRWARPAVSASRSSLAMINSHTCQLVSPYMVVRGRFYYVWIEALLFHGVCRL